MDLKTDVVVNTEQQEEQQQKKQEEQQHFHVLAVDDSLIDRKLLEKLLRISSYKVTCVESGDKALKYLGLLDDDIHNLSSTSSSSSSSSQLSQQEEQGLKVNLIMTDYCMPGMNGYDLLKRLKGSSWKDVPVVVMSSENVPSRINMCLEGGAEEFLLKPVQLSDLKKLQPYLLKTNNQTCENINNEDFTDITEVTDYKDKAGRNNNSSSNKSNNNNNVSKRKAMSPKASESERRPKMKELTVV